MLPSASEPVKCLNHLAMGSSSVETRESSSPLFEAEPRRNGYASYPTTSAPSNAFIDHNKVQSAIATSAQAHATNRYDFVHFLDQLRLRYGVSSFCSITLIMDRYLAVEATQQNGIPVIVAAVFSLHMKLEYGELMIPAPASKEDLYRSPYDYLCMNVEDIAQRLTQLKCTQPFGNLLCVNPTAKFVYNLRFDRFTPARLSQLEREEHKRAAP
eukprot:GEMP01035055.1.p2 GENE.GEMP01035055.1~~GEMP01035055.1.p2  ORF type:complete len:213 (+),score=33.49 GEMP01035055.1:54-692(+)